MKSEKEVVFKPNHKPIIAILIICLIGIIILKQFRGIDDVFFYGLGSTVVILMLIQFYKQTQYDFILKINQHELSFKNDKKTFKLKDIQSFYTTPKVYNQPSKLNIEHKGIMEILILENFNRAKLNKVSQILTEKIRESQKN